MSDHDDDARVPDAPGVPGVPGVPLQPADQDELVDGRTLDELEDYLDRGRTPRDPGIEASAECRLTLRALERVRGLSLSVLEDEASRLPSRDDTWIAGLIDSIKAEVVGGRDIPLRHPDPGVRLGVTEAAVRGLLRQVGDAVDGVVVRSSELDGDVTEAGAPIEVTLTMTARYGVPLREAAGTLRAAAVSALTLHTELRIAAVHVVVDDVWLDEGGAS
ncbi:hypothetical protein [Frigoribacterium sp. VKM Ac-2530]|uniref:hypothetical protein n=1 Tax=Frigoribacterium sp. VKM Ac-2530 TaxID=2783822 RepID=UPI00188D1CD5|nr:hypothetical protein [Frigoribacterium sp. VKM Ac-2530]MBF4580178.1 hypothetical protein [Frigoribacterium sp. VKM Ac-2530]